MKEENTVSVTCKNGIYTLSGGDVSYVLYVTEEKQLLNLYWGKRLPEGALEPELSDWPGFASFDLPTYHLPWEVPVLGQGWYGEPAVDVVNAQGDHVMDLRFVDARILPGKQPLRGLPATYVEEDSEATTLEMDLKDTLTGLQVTLRYAVYEKTGASVSR